jgi:hypothetical protein
VPGAVDHHERLAPSSSSTITTLTSTLDVLATLARTGPDAALTA